jgi:hypothetical protein
VKYEVRYLTGGEEQTDEVDAPDASAAVSLVQYEHGRDDSTFELLSVTVLDSGDQPLDANRHSALETDA